MLHNHPVLFVSWRSPKSRRIHSVGRLAFDAPTHQYEFRYIHSALTASKDGFTPFPEFPRLEGTFRSVDLFPLFANRVMPTTRAGYADFLTALGLDPATARPMAILARTGGRRETDQIELFPMPQHESGNCFATTFLLRAIRYMPQPATDERIQRLKAGEKLFWMLDLQNPADPAAIAVRTEDNVMIGYLPAYLTADFSHLQEQCGMTQVLVERVNLPPAEAHHRLLCKIESCWPDSFRPFNTTEFQTIQNMTPAATPS